MRHDPPLPDKPIRQETASLSHAGTRIDVTPTSTRKALLFVYVGYFARYLQLLILIPFYGHVLGAAEYGKVLAAMSLFNVVWMIVQYGFPLVGIRDVTGTTDQAAIAVQFGRQIKARLLMSVVGIAFGACGIAFSPLLRANPVYGVIATAMGVVAAFNVGWFFQANHRFRTSILLEVAGFAINLVLILSLVRDASDGLLVLLSMFVSSVVTLLAAYVIAIHRIDVRNIRFSGGASLIRESSPMFAASGVPVLMTSASTYLLSLFRGAEQVGFFGAAERLATIGLSLMTPAGQVLMAIVAKRLSAPDTAAHAYALMRKTLVLMGCFGITACLSALVLSPSLIPLILGPGFESSIRITQVLGLMFPFVAFSQAVRLYVLFPLRQDQLVTMSTVVGAVFNVLAVFLLASDFGGLGVAAARVSGEIVSAAILAVALIKGKIYGQIFRASKDANSTRGVEEATKKHLPFQP